MNKQGNDDPKLLEKFQILIPYTFSFMYVFLSFGSEWQMPL